MRIKRIHIKNFRSILDEYIDCDSLTALVGRNGSGKSSFLSALQLFYESSSAVNREDFYSESLSQNIEVAVTFTDLSGEAKGLFSSYMDKKDLTVVRVFSDPELGKSGTYHGIRLQNAKFDDIRKAGGKRDITGQYNKVRESGEYPSLPTVRSADDALKALEEWESQNPTECSPSIDDGQFFGFTQVARGYLGRYTRLINIPAVRDALEDATEKKGSSVTEIMDLVVRSALANRKELTEFRQRTQNEYNEIMNPQNLSELGDLERALSNTLQSYVPEASVRLQWSEFGDVFIPMPQAQIKLREDDYEARVERTGHGLQRAFIVTMLQHLLAAREKQAQLEDKDLKGNGIPKKIDNQLPDLVLAIEEPELYQHPSRQRHLASVFLKLSSGLIPGVAKNTQVLYTTHSPLFVGLDRFDQIRVLRKISAARGQPKETRVKRVDMGQISTELSNMQEGKRKKFTPETLRARLQAVMTPWMNEGFFADLVVLVEGEGDRAPILGAAHSMNYDLDAMGVTVIPCFGKPNLDRPLVIFRQLDIPVYMVWDGDCDAKEPKPENNRYLLRLLGEPEEDWPEFIGSSYACFKNNIGKTMESEIGGALFNQLLLEVQVELGIVKKEHALKNPVVMQRILAKASSDGGTNYSLHKIVENIVALKTKTEGVR